MIQEQHKQTGGLKQNLPLKRINRNNLTKKYTFFSVTKEGNYFRLRNKMYKNIWNLENYVYVFYSLTSPLPVINHL